MKMRRMRSNYWFGSCSEAALSLMWNPLLISSVLFGLTMHPLENGIYSVKGEAGWREIKEQKLARSRRGLVFDLKSRYFGS